MAALRAGAVALSPTTVARLSPRNYWRQRQHLRVLPLALGRWRLAGADAAIAGTGHSITAGEAAEAVGGGDGIGRVGDGSGVPETTGTCSTAEATGTAGTAEAGVGTRANNPMIAPQRTPTSYDPVRTCRD